MLRGLYFIGRVCKAIIQWQIESCLETWDQWIFCGLGNSVLDLLNGILRSYPMYPSFVFEVLHFNA